MKYFFVFLTLLSHSSLPLFAQDDSFTMTQIGTNNLLTTPWDLHYGPDGYLWITERSIGRVVRVNPETAERDNLIQISEVYSSVSQDGLLGMSLHKDFLNGSPYVFLSYTYLVSGKRAQKLVRYTYETNGNDGQLHSPITLIDNLPASNDHNSGRLIFGPDNKLYYTIGDQGVKDCDTNLAQFLPTQQEIDAKNWKNYPGKILRLQLDGSIPNDNPVINGVKSHIYSYGHRNPQGIVFSSNGTLYSDEHGPSSDDEVNILTPGKNYGWPYVAGVRDNLMYDSDGCLTNETSFNEPNYQDPLISLFLPDSYRDPACTDNWMCRPNIAPSSVDIYQSAIVPNWTNSLLVTSLKKGRVYRLQLNATGTAVEGVTQHFYTQNRYRDLVIDANGNSIYVITDASGKTADASGMNIKTSVNNPGAILKFTYESALSFESKTIPKVIVWPNPSSETVHISLGNLKYNQLHYSLLNTLGQVLVSGVVDGSTSSIKINKSEVPCGAYFLKLDLNGKILQKQLIIN